MKQYDRQSPSDDLYAEVFDAVASAPGAINIDPNVDRSKSKTRLKLNTAKPDLMTPRSEALAQQVSDLLDNRGVSVRKAAEKTGLSLETILRLRHGKPVRTSTLKLFLETFGESFDLWQGFVFPALKGSDQDLVKENPNLLSLDGMSPIQKSLMRMIGDLFCQDTSKQPIQAHDVIRLPHFTENDRRLGQRLTYFSLAGPSFKGLVAKVLKIFASFGGNVVGLCARTGGGYDNLMVHEVLPIGEETKDIEEAILAMLEEEMPGLSDQYTMSSILEENVRDGSYHNIELILQNQPGTLAAALEKISGFGLEIVAVQNLTIDHNGCSNYILVFEPSELKLEGAITHLLRSFNADTTVRQVKLNCPTEWSK